MKTTIILLMLAVTSATGSFASTAFSLPSGAKDTANEAVAGEAIFSLSGSILTITVLNLTGNVRSDGQNITGITFGLTGLAASGSTLTGTNADLINVGSGGVISDLTTTSASKINDLTHWAVTATSLNDLTLSTFTGGAPIQGIIGLPNSGNVFSNGNASIDGGGAKNPYAYDQAVFTVNLAGSNFSLANLSNVMLNFGTGGATSNQIAATVITSVATPEPTTTAMFFGGAGMIFLVYKFRKRSN